MVARFTVAPQLTQVVVLGVALQPCRRATPWLLLMAAPLACALAVLDPVDEEAMELVVAVEVWQLLQHL